MNQFQPISFDTVAEMLAYIPLEEQKIVEQLRLIVLDCIPGVKEKLAYNVPFYYRQSRICYIWPGSVPWGKVKEGVSFGLCRGDLLTNASYLEAGERKQVYTKTFTSIRDIDREKLSQLLYEAVWIDAEEKKHRRLKRAGKP